MMVESFQIKMDFMNYETSVDTVVRFMIRVYTARE